MEPEGRNQETAVPEAGNRRVHALDAIRRALGRLSVQTKIRKVEVSRLVASPHVRSCSVSAGPRLIPGAFEDSINSPAVVVTKLGAPRAEIAGGVAVPGASDSLFGCPVSENLAALIAASPARVGDSLISDLQTMTAELIVDNPAEREVHTASITPYGGQAKAQPGFLLTKRVEVGRLPVARIVLSTQAQGRLAGSRRTPPSGLPRFATPSVARVPQSVAERIPLDRRRLPMPSRGSLEWQAAFLQERQLLAHAAGPGVSFTDIELVGVYRNVPITAARRLEVEKDTNALLLYLRPQVAMGDDAGQKPAVSIALGRVKSDGRLVRAVIR